DKDLDTSEETMKKLFAIVCVGLAIISAICAQTSPATISGIVTDASGAIVSGAVVKVTDLAKNTTYQTRSNDAGLYVVSELPPGNYRVTVEIAGFRTYE